MNRATWGRPMAGLLAVAVVVALAAGLGAADGPPPATADDPPTPPLGLPPAFWPDDNPYSTAKANLGRFLYYDTRLSSDNTVSCASCHAPEKAFGDGLAVSLGIGKQKGGRSAPTVINRAYSTQQFWDGRAASLEEQAKGPLANPLEMTADKDADAAHKAVVRRIRDVPGYVPLFQKAFGGEVQKGDDITIDHVAKAIATFERIVYSGNAPYDRYQAGELNAMSPAQVRGLDVFTKKAACDACHLGFNFTDGSYVNIGVGWDKGTPADLGRFKVTEREEDKGAFKTPTLREIVRTGPYMHDGSMATLEEVVDHYDKGGNPNPYLDQRIVPLKLSAQEKSDLIAFLHALSGEGWQNLTAPSAQEFPR
jgi:cytochrome c peroxidase